MELVFKEVGLVMGNDKNLLSRIVYGGVEYVGMVGNLDGVWVYFEREGNWGFWVWG